MTCSNKICSRAIFSQSISLVTVGGVDTLLIDIPAAEYANGGRYCLFVTQAIPAANWNVPVAISIGGNTTTVYPLMINGSQVIVKQLNTGWKYPVRVNTSGSGSFIVLEGMRCSPTTAPAFLPLTVAAAASASVAKTTTLASTPRTKVVKAPAEANNG